MFHWFSTNHEIANAGNCHVLTSSKTPVDRVKLLGVNFEGRLNFDFHVNILLKKASEKYHALARVCNYMNKKTRHISMNALITSQFFYCPLV